MKPNSRILACNWRCLRHPQAGGAEVNLFEQARRWVRDGHSVTVLTADPGRKFAPEQCETIYGVEVRRMGGRFTVYLAVAWFLLFHARAFDYILDVANGIPFFTPLVTRRPVTLLVHHVHDRQWFSEFAWPIAVVGRFVERHVVPAVYRFTPVIAVSPTTREALAASGMDESQIRVIYNGVVPPTVPPANAQDRDPHRIVYVGRVKRYKRLDLLLDAVLTLRESIPDVHLDIAGDGDARDDLARFVAESGLAEHVTLHGFVDDATKESLLNRAAVFAIASMHEGWGLSVIEANSYGLGAVAYDVPGLRTAIVEGHTGLLARSDAEFVNALRRVLLEDGLRAELGANAVRWAARFDWDRCARETLAIMQAVEVPHASDSPELEVASA